MKSLIACTVIFILALSFSRAETNKPPAGISAVLEKDRVWDSVAINHEPIEAIRHLDCWFVACRSKSSMLHDPIVIYYDPQITSVTVYPFSKKEIRIVIRKGSQIKTFYLKSSLKEPYQWVRLDHKALLTLVDSMRPH